VEIMDNPQMYAGKTVVYRAIMCKPPQYGRYFTPGRFAMVCCADDMTFLALLLSSLYEPEEEAARFHCIVHPFRRQDAWSDPLFDYCGKMNVALAYYNCLDDWHDDKSLIKLLMAKVLQRSCRKIGRQYPRQMEAISSGLARLSRLEQENCQQPDLPANAFGRIMGELFVCREDNWAPTLRAIGESLGRFIYILDAAIDLEADRKRRRYNPLLSHAQDGKTLADYEPELLMLIGECSREFEKLPLLQDIELLRNILYCGVWGKYHLAIGKQTEKEDCSSCSPPLILSAYHFMYAAPFLRMPDDCSSRYPIYPAKIKANI